MLTVLILSHSAATLALTGLIWFVQIVHYPLFGCVGEREFAAYERSHARRTSLVVVPLMLIEATSAVALTVLLPDPPLAWVGLGLLIVVWLSTFFWQVPQHRKLANGYDVGAHQRLVKTNWLRTAAWSARSAVALALWPQVI